MKRRVASNHGVRSPTFFTFHPAFGGFADSFYDWHRRKTTL